MTVGTSRPRRVGMHIWVKGVKASPAGIARMDDPHDTDVLCLCAAWCRLCDRCRRVLDEAAAEWRAAGQTWRWHWLDIGDDCWWATWTSRPSRPWCW